jgi:hypothetical protein
MNEDKSDITDIVVKAAEIYNQNVVLKYAVNQIPFVGFFIDQLFANTGREIHPHSIQYIHSL